jgi:hypothetical protein
LYLTPLVLVNLRDLLQLNQCCMLPIAVARYQAVCTYLFSANSKQLLISSNVTCFETTSIFFLSSVRCPTMLRNVTQSVLYHFWLTTTYYLSHQWTVPL